MNWYKFSQDNTQEIQIQLQRLVESLKSQYPGLDLHAYYAASADYIELQNMSLPPEMQSQGIGTKVIQRIQELAQSFGKTIALSPQADPRKKGKLDKFYKGLGFVPNRGRNSDLRITPSRLWNPR